MRIDPSHGRELRPLGSNEVVGHTQHDLADDFEVVVDQQVVVLDDRTSEGVLDGHHGAVGFVANHGFEHLVEFAFGTRFDGITQDAPTGLLGESAAFSLKGDAKPALSLGGSSIHDG